MNEAGWHWRCHKFFDNQQSNLNFFFKETFDLFFWPPSEKKPFRIGRVIKIFLSLSKMSRWEIKTFCHTDLEGGGTVCSPSPPVKCFSIPGAPPSDEETLFLCLQPPQVRLGPHLVGRKAVTISTATSSILV